MIKLIHVHNMEHIQISIPIDKILHLENLSEYSTKIVCAIDGVREEIICKASTKTVEEQIKHVLGKD